VSAATLEATIIVAKANPIMTPPHRSPLTLPREKGVSPGLTAKL
jgi:hypothetical protein